MTIIVNSPRITKHVFTFMGFEKPIALSVADCLAIGLEGTAVCWMFFWKYEHRKVRVVQDSMMSFDNPRDTEVNMYTVKI